MQDSWVNTAFTEIKLYRFRPLHLRFNGLWETNRQGATDFRGDNWLRRWSMVLRSDYTWSRGNLSVIPQVKFMAQKVVDDEGEVAPVHESFFYPIFKVEYQMTRDTVVRMGAQGIPLPQESVPQSLAAGYQLFHAGLRGQSDECFELQWISARHQRGLSTAPASNGGPGAQV